MGNGMRVAAGIEGLDGGGDGDGEGRGEDGWKEGGGEMLMRWWIEGTDGGEGVRYKSQERKREEIGRTGQRGS